MGALFGKSKPKSRVTTHDKAVLQLKQQRDKLKLYQKRLANVLESDRVLAKKLLTENKKDRAKLILRKKRFQEQILAKTDVQLDNLERLTHDLEFAQVEIQVFDGLKVGNEALKQIHDVLNIDDIERILDETNEGIEKQREIDAVITGTLTSEDDDAIEAEYEEMIAEEMPEIPDEQTEENETKVELPDIPVDEPVPDEDGDKPAKERVKAKKVAVEA